MTHVNVLAAGRRFYISRISYFAVKSPIPNPWSSSVLYFAPRSSARDLSEFADNNFDKVNDKVEDKVYGTGVHSWLKECFCPHISA
jgi:hypothetical protein